MNSYTLYFTPLPSMICLIGMLICWIRLRKAGYSWQRQIVFICFWMYSMLILSQALFPIPLVTMDAASARREMAEVLNRINWMPFHYGYYTIGRAVFREVVFNILITVPAGFVLPALFKLKKRGVFIALVVSGLGIEILQLSLSLGVRLAYRVVDISDVLLNAGGFLIGLGLLRLFSRWHRFF